MLISFDCERAERALMTLRFMWVTLKRHKNGYGCLKISFIYVLKPIGQTFLGDDDEYFVSM